MKKQLSLFIWAVAAFGMSPVFGATNSGMRGASTVDLTGGPAVRSQQEVNYKKYQMRTDGKTYESKDGKSLYYTQPSRRSDLYKAYDGASSSISIRTSRRETSRETAKRKYFLAHPFFQPAKGKFGSVTDLGYNMGSYDFDIQDPTLNMLSGKWDMGMFSIKEDFSYGITDTISLMAMARFDIAEYKFKWNDHSPTDKDDDTNLNLMGLGGQWRFVDNSQWIANLGLHFQHQRDLSNNFVLEAKGGYKYGRSTIYGIGRAWYVNFDGDVYGNGVTDQGQTMIIVYDTGHNAFYAEGGVGVFSVLDQDWTLNVEGMFSYYDWHNQLSLRAAIGWQPNDWVALNLYAKTNLYDSANDKTLDAYARRAGDAYYFDLGGAKLDNYHDTSFGLQAIFYF